MKNFLLALLILGGSVCFAQGSAKSELPSNKKIVKQYDLQGNCVVDYLENESLCKELASQLESTLKLKFAEDNSKNKDLKELYSKAKLIAFSKGDYFSALKYLEKKQALENAKASLSIKPEIEKAYLETMMELGSSKNDRFKKELENNLCENLISTSLETIENELESSYTATFIPPGNLKKVDTKLGTEVNEEIELHQTPETHVFQILNTRMQQHIHLAYYEEVYKPVIHKIRKQKLKYQN
ncbi:hypothetical protein [Salegentibacter chungangensis]|uniref:Peptidylprolyl isomerase n=1 Tax=Salegentibacter chungangensis TaxID=1335724 RepID=A0ABW3NV34_9FLAO